VSLAIDVPPATGTRLTEKKRLHQLERYLRATQSLVSESYQANSSLYKKLKHHCEIVIDVVGADTVAIFEFDRSKKTIEFIADAHRNISHSKTSGGKTPFRRGEILRLSSSDSSILSEQAEDNTPCTFTGKNSLLDIISDHKLCSSSLNNVNLIRVPIQNYHCDVFKLAINSDDHAGENRSNIAFFSEAISFISSIYQQEYLETAKEEAERANSAKSKFLSKISHELRTPLHAILGYSELLARSSAPFESTDLDDSIKSITSAGEHMQYLIDDLLDMAAIEADKIRINVTSCAIVDLTEQAIAYVKTTAEDKRTKIEFSVDLTPTTQVLTDPKRALQILLNLLSNAVKYTPAGGIITVKLSKNEDSVFVRVKDSGPGISEAKRGKLFMPFERLGQETSDNEGVGLGLVIAKRLAELMDSDIGLSSEQGAGAEFWLELPAAKSRKDNNNQSPHSVLEHPFTAKEKRHKILCVEDNPVNMKILERLFSNSNSMQATYCDRPSKAISIAKNRPFDLVLLDINMQEMDGEQLLEKLRLIPALKSTPFFAMTADADFETRLEKSGFSACLTKPFSFMEFIPTLEKYLNGE